MNKTHNLDSIVVKNIDGVLSAVGSFAEFGWDSKHAAVNVLFLRFVSCSTSTSASFTLNADKFLCSILPESLTRSVSYSPGGLIFKPGGSNLQHATALSFLLLVYSHYLTQANGVVYRGNVVATPALLIQVAKSQADYILGTNPMKMSNMVGYGKNFPQRIHHRGSSLPSKDQHQERIECNGGTPYFNSNNPNHNLLIGAVVGGPDINDSYSDSRSDFVQSEPTTYINAPLAGVLAYFKSHPY